MWSITACAGNNEPTVIMKRCVLNIHGIQITWLEGCYFLNCQGIRITITEPVESIRFYGTMKKVPQMPTGYPGMMLLSLLPPVWFSVMHPRIAGLEEA